MLCLHSQISSNVWPQKSHNYLEHSFQCCTTVVDCNHVNNAAIMGSGNTVCINCNVVASYRKEKSRPVTNTDGNESSSNKTQFPVQKSLSLHPAVAKKKQTGGRGMSDRDIQCNIHHSFITAGKFSNHLQFI